MLLGSLSMLLFPFPETFGTIQGHSAFRRLDSTVFPHLGRDILSFDRDGWISVIIINSTSYLATTFQPTTQSPESKRTDSLEAV